MRKLSITLLLACFLWGGVAFGQAQKKNPEEKQIKTKKVDAKVYRIKNTPKKMKLDSAKIQRIEIRPSQMKAPSNSNKSKGRKERGSSE